MKKRGRPFGYSPIGGNPMHPVISIPVSEATGITHISKVHGKAFPRNFSDSEAVHYRNGRRREDVNKL